MKKVVVPLVVVLAVALKKLDKNHDGLAD